MVARGEVQGDRDREGERRRGGEEKTATSVMHQKGITRSIIILMAQSHRSVHASTRLCFFKNPKATSATTEPGLWVWDWVGEAWKGKI